MAAASELDGPTLGPASGRPPTALVVLLHGLGADGHDLIGLAHEWAPLLPDAAFLSPHAPFPCDMAPFGRQWFSLQERTASAILAGIQVAAPILDAWLDSQLARLGLTDDRLALVGFSQGTMMALYTAPRRPRASDGARPAEPAPAPATRTPRVRLVSALLEPTRVTNSAELRDALLRAGAISITVADAAVAAAAPEPRALPRGYWQEQSFLARLHVHVLVPDDAVGHVRDVLDRFGAAGAETFVQDAERIPEETA